MKTGGSEETQLISNYQFLQSTARIIFTDNNIPMPERQSYSDFSGGIKGYGNAVWKRMKAAIVHKQAICLD